MYKYRLQYERLVKPEYTYVRKASNDPLIRLTDIAIGDDLEALIEYAEKNYKREKVRIIDTQNNEDVVFRAGHTIRRG
jgi:hypothetical protein